MIRGKTRHQLFLPDELSRRLTAMAKSQKRARSDLLLEMVEAYMNRRTASQTEDRLAAKLDRLAREVSKTNNECVVISHSLYRFIRHQLIYAAALPAPGEDAKAQGEKRFQAFLDSVAQMMAKGADNDNQPPEVDKANQA
ncbi:MAG TPA: CopG family transcriptional regulator [Alphaproteobacteria bacterium]|nr:CopG family transcriptional regulator [Alphaproteobacteria bacterium]